MKIIILILTMFTIFGFLACSLTNKKNETTSNLSETPGKTIEPTNSKVDGQTQLAPTADTLSIALTRFRDGKQQSVKASETFVEQDGIRLTVSVVEKGYVTIIYKGSDEDAQVLFPNKQYFNGKNEIEPNQNVVIPNKGWFFFDEKKGTETVYVVYSKNRPPAEMSKNPKETLSSLEKMRSDNNNADSFTTKDNNLVRVIELKHN